MGAPRIEPGTSRTKYRRRFNRSLAPTRVVDESTARTVTVARDTTGEPPSPNPFGNNAEDDRREEAENGAVETTEART